ncbi:MAG TPA: hypothetical protein PKY81_02590 [bacterium]|nr:hypothetical protein [bacterium]
MSGLSGLSAGLSAIFAISEKKRLKQWTKIEKSAYKKTPYPAPDILKKGVRLQQNQQTSESLPYTGDILG